MSTMKVHDETTRVHKKKKTDNLDYIYFCTNKINAVNIRKEGGDLGKSSQKVSQSNF